MRNIFIILLSIFCSSLFSDIPDGYYDGTEYLSGEALKSALNDIIKDHVEFSYDDLRDFILKDTDEDPQNSDNVILVYTGWSRAKDDFGGGPSDWNREHVWAKSHGDFGTAPPCGTDAHHIRPSDTSVNSARSNLDFDNGGNEYIDGDGPTGCHFDFNSWEPRPEVKGDVARMIFYMDVRYEGEYGEPDLEMVDWVNSAPENQPYHGKKSTLLSWHHEDPPDDWEMLRNDKIYSYQQNRNPFIDHPEFVERIWEDVAAEDFFISSRKISLSNHPNPFNPETVITFAAPDKQETAQLVIFDLKGRIIAEADVEIHNSTEGTYRWNAEKQNSGIYFYQVKISGFNTSTGKMILLK